MDAKQAAPVVTGASSQAVETEFSGRLLTVAARPLEFLLGLLLLVAALLKAADPQLFAAQIHNYQVIQNVSLLAPTALFTLGFETFLGVALLLGLRLRMAVLLLAQFSLLGFTLLIAYAWIVHGIEDCGCFGPVKSPPGISIAKNLVMMLMAGVAWLGFARQGAMRDTPRAGMFKGVASLLAALLVIGYSYPHLYGATPEETPEGPVLFAGYTLENDFGELMDLGSGEYLVALLSSTCEHCMETVPALNEVFLDPNLPPLVSIAFEPQPGSLDTFAAITDPWFPMHSLGNDFLTFSRMIGSAPPRLSHVRDGRVVQYWDALEPDYAFPAAHEIEAAVAAAQQQE